MVDAIADNMRVPMESRGVKFLGDVAYIRSSRGSLRNIDLAPGDGCWHTVQQYEAQLLYDNHSSIVSLSLSDLDEDNDDKGVQEYDSSQSLRISDDHLEDDGDVGETELECSPDSSSVNKCVKQELADETERLSKRTNRAVFSKPSASDLAKYVEACLKCLQSNYSLI
jgi:hypothetical protein